MNKCKLHLKSGNIPDSKFDKHELAVGTKVEMDEHTNNRACAKAVAKAHLNEFMKPAINGKPQPTGYYSALAVMERRLKNRR